MPRNQKRYKLKYIERVFKFALTGKSVMIDTYDGLDYVTIMNWVGEGKKMYNTDVARVYKDLTYELTEAFCEQPREESSINTISETTQDQQWRFAARQQTKYFIELALTCFPG